MICVPLVILVCLLWPKSSRASLCSSTDACTTMAATELPKQPLTTDADAINLLLNPRNFGKAGSPQGHVPSITPHDQTVFTGGDVDSTTLLTCRYMIMLYGDTMLGQWNTSLPPQEFGNRVCNSKFPKCFDIKHMPHTSVGIWDKLDQKMTYWWRTTTIEGRTNNKTVPKSFLTPEWQEAHHEFWGTSIAPAHNDTLCIVGIRVEMVNASKAHPMGFYNNGTYVVCLDGVQSRPTAPLTWGQRWTRLPRTGPNNVGGDYKYAVEWHNALYAEYKDERQQNATTIASINGANCPATVAPETIYMFGELKHPNYPTAQLLSKISWHDFLNFNFEDSMRVYSPQHNTWITINALLDGDSTEQHQEEVNHSHSEKVSSSSYSPEQQRIWSPSVPEFTIQWSIARQEYYSLYLHGHVSSIMCMRTSKLIEGPWNNNCSTIVDVLQAPFNHSNDVFCYATKTHPSLDYLISQEPSSTDTVSSAEQHVRPSEAQEKKTTKKNNTKERHVYSFVCNAFNVTKLFDEDMGRIYTPIYRVLNLGTIVSGRRGDHSGNDRHHSTSSGWKTVTTALCVSLAVAVVLLIVVMVANKKKNKKMEVFVGDDEGFDV